MTMHYVQVFLNENALVLLEDEFVDKEDDLRHLIYDPVKTMAKATKMQITQNQFVAKIYDDDAPNKTGTETIQLADYDLDKFAVPSDPDWLPDNVDASDAKPYKIRVGDKTWNLLLDYFKFYNARCDVFNKTLPSNLRENEKERAIPAECYEKILHEALIGTVIRKIDNAIDKELEDEFKEVYATKKEKSAEKRKQRSGKK